MTEINNTSVKRIYDIHCINCGAAARYDIRKHQYACSYCGSNVSVSQAIEEKKGFRKLQHKKIQDTIGAYPLKQAVCSGCGAELIFEEDEALSSCPFCEKALVREEYVKAQNIPEAIIGFDITKKQAQELLSSWCKENRNKKEAKELSDHISELQGYYLPYEFLKGPMGMSVRRIDGGKLYSCMGYFDEAFVNSSGQFDNLLLEGMEPYDLKKMDGFDFGYIAGQRVKVDNVSKTELNKRIKEESAKIYTPTLSKVLETKALNIDANTSELLEMPVLLPAYYLRAGKTAAAINGQTGRIAVKAADPSHFYFIPWWAKAILYTLLFTLISYLGFTLFKVERPMALLFSGILGFFFLIVLLCAYSDTTKNAFRMESGYQIFNSGPHIEADPAAREPVFYRMINDKQREVVYEFSSLRRMVRMIVLSLLVLFAPVIIALLLRGFDFRSIQLSGSAVWFCIFVPVIPIYLIKFGRIDIYDNPWIYTVDENEKRRRFHEGRTKQSALQLIKNVLRYLFVPPICFATWFAIASLLTMIYLTAGLS